MCTGGFIDTNESDYDAIKREIMEEIGIDISDTSQYVWLGRLQNRYFGPKSKLLLPHVFLYLGKSPPVVKLAPKEVTAVRWINANVFLDQYLGHGGHITYPVSAMLKGKARQGSMKHSVLTTAARAFGCANIYFPCVRIPMTSTSTDRNEPSSVCPRNCGVNCTKDCWIVWGITYNTLRSIISLYHEEEGKYHASHTAHSSSSHSMNPPATFWVDNVIFNAFLTMFDRWLFDEQKKKDKNGYTKLIVYSLACTSVVYFACIATVGFAIQSFLQLGGISNEC